MTDERIEAIRHRTEIALRAYKSEFEGGTNDGYSRMHGFQVARDIRDILDGEIPRRCEECDEFMVTCENPLSCKCATTGCSRFNKAVLKSPPLEEEPPEGWAKCHGCLRPIEGARDTVMVLEKPDPPRRWHGMCYRVVHSPMPI